MSGSTRARLPRRGLAPPGEGSLQPIRMSENTSRFWYTNHTGHPSVHRIARIAAEAVGLVGGEGAKWVVLVDDDTVFCADKLVVVLGKYDWREVVYVEAPSESYSADTYFSHNIAFGGSGVALSFPSVSRSPRCLPSASRGQQGSSRRVWTM